MPIRITPMLEAVAVSGATVLAFRPLALALGGGPASGAIVQVLSFTLAPVAWVLLLRRDPAAFGLRVETPGPSLRLAVRAYAFAEHACMVFPVTAWLGWALDGWPGSGLVAAVFLAILPLVVRAVSPLPTHDGRGGTGRSLAALVMLATGATALSALTASSAPFVSRLLYYTLVVGISEEVVFRGLIQSLLNRAFGRTWTWRGVRFWPGAIIAAVLFGLAHPIVATGFSLPLALYSASLGLMFLREKDGSVLAPAMAHGLVDAPRAFLG